MKNVLVLLSLALLFLAARWNNPTTPPTISDIPNQVTQVNTPTGPINFTVGDVETSVDSLYVTGVSRDTFLVPPSNIVFGGSGASRNVTITPAINASGTVVIEIWVSDGVESTVDTFLLKINTPPQLDFNLPLTVLEGDSGVITTALLHAIDPDNSTSQVSYHIGVDSGYAQHGIVRVNNVAVPIGGTFTQDDVDNNRVTYHHDGSETTSDLILFSVTDADGGMASDNGFTVFHFNVSVTPVNDPPAVSNASYSTGIGAALNGTFTATDPDSPTLHFSITTNGTLGTATITDSTAGTFTYVPNSGASGTDSILFQAYDGALFADHPGRILVTIANQAPTAENDSAVTIERGGFTDTLHATDPDLPPQTLIYTILNAGHLGTAVMMDSTAGIFTYTVLPNKFGIDTLVFTVSDGLLTSTQAFFKVTIRPAVDAGDILVAESKGKALVLIDPSTGAQGLVSSGGLLERPVDVVVEPSGKLVMLDGANGLIRIDPATGAQATLTPSSAFTTGPLGPTGLAIEHDGSILVADGTAGVKRVNPGTGAVSVLSSGTNLNLVVGVAVDAGGNVFVGDASLLGGGTSALVRVNPVTGAQTPITSGGSINLPVGVTLDAAGTVYLCEPASFLGAPSDLVLKVDSSTGVVTPIVPSETLHVPTGLDIDGNGKLLVANNQGASVMSIDPTSGATTVVSSGGYLQQPFGLAVVRPKPEFHADRTDIDFGTLNVGANREDSIVVTNTGSATLYISSVTADSIQFTVTPGIATIAPAASATFHVTFTPTSGDTINGHIVFVHNAFGSPSSVAVHGLGTAVGVQEPGNNIPKTFNLYANYPNPFNPSTTLRFDIARQSTVTLKIYSLLGTEVATVLNRRLTAAGSYTEVLDASALASGVYFYELRADGVDGTSAFRSVKKMVLLR